MVRLNNKPSAIAIQAFVNFTIEFPFLSSKQCIFKLYIHSMHIYRSSKSIKTSHYPLLPLLLPITLEY